jgi:hypothetical protein
MGVALPRVLTLEPVAFPPGRRGGPRPSLACRALLLALHGRGRPLTLRLQDFRFFGAIKKIAGCARRDFRLATEFSIVETPQPARGLENDARRFC